MTTPFLSAKGMACETNGLWFHKQKFYIVSQARPTFSKEWINSAYKLCSITSHNAVMVLVSLVPKLDFSRQLENCVRSTTYSIFIQVGQNAGRLFFSNLMLEVNEDCILMYKQSTSSMDSQWAILAAANYRLSFKRSTTRLSRS